MHRAAVQRRPATEATRMNGYEAAFVTIVLVVLATLVLFAQFRPHFNALRGIIPRRLDGVMDWVFGPRVIRVVLAGLDNSGKTTLFHMLQNHSPTGKEFMQTTVRFNIPRTGFNSDRFANEHVLTATDTSVPVTGTVHMTELWRSHSAMAERLAFSNPEHRLFRLRGLLSSYDAVCWMVDARDADRWSEAGHKLRELWATGVDSAPPAYVPPISAGTIAALNAASDAVRSLPLLVLLNKYETSTPGPPPKGARLTSTLPKLPDGAAAREKYCARVVRAMGLDSDWKVRRRFEELTACALARTATAAATDSAASSNAHAPLRELLPRELFMIIADYIERPIRSSPLSGGQTVADTDAVDRTWRGPLYVTTCSLVMRTGYSAGFKWLFNTAPPDIIQLK